ncbi:MAG: SPOR domain-containing protein [Clostridium sp.]|nr:SPOR domain-containing protein [Clostridium sp.]
MKELSRHIENLLLSNDCVVIPRFGGFVTRQVASQRVDEEQLFLPPLRTVGFNPQLQTNDGLLVNSFMKTYRVDEAEAKKMLNQKVLLLRQTLLENGTCDFEGIGLFTQNEDGEILFSPYEAGTVCPAYYGLDAFEFPTLQTDAECTAMKNQQVADEQQKDEDKHITIQISRRLINYVSASAAAILLFVLLSPTAANIEGGREQIQMSQMLIPTAIMQQMDASEQQSDTLTNNRQTAPEIATEPHMEVENPEVHTALQNTEDQTLSTDQATGYAVVVVSSISEKNAHQYVENLKKRGIEGARVYVKGKMVRVIFNGFETESAAYAKMNNLKHNYTDFETAWVLNLN